MKRNIRLYPLTLVFAILAAVVMPLLPPVAPVYAIATHTWTTKADFDAGVLNNVDTSYSPGDVVLATNLDTGNGDFGFLDVDDMTTTDWRRAAINQQSNAGSNVVYVATPTEPFFAGDEVLIIQMTGTGAGSWETSFVQAVNPGHLVLTENLAKTYYADGNSKSQVIMIPQFKDVTVHDGGVLTCDAWDGSTGGIVFFRSTGTVTVEPGGRIDASGKGLGGGGGGSGGDGGQGGDGGNFATLYKDGGNAGVAGTGGKGGRVDCHCGAGGDGAWIGYSGAAGSQGSTGSGSAGGSSGQGGANGSSNNLSLLQVGSGGGGGQGGRGGDGGGGQGGGGGGDIGSSNDGISGSQGGAGGTGGTGGRGAGAIIICAREIIVDGNVGAAGSSGSGGDTGNDGHNGKTINDEGSGGQGSFVCGGSGGGGGVGARGGDGGNGGGGGAAGTIWFAADNITVGNSLVVAAGGSGGNGGGGGGGGSGTKGGAYGGTCDDCGWCNGYMGDDGSHGPGGHTGNTSGNGGLGKIRLDYVTVSGNTNPAPSYVSGLYASGGSIASDVWDTGSADMAWRELSWQETLHGETDITFEARASNTAFSKDDVAPAWISVGDNSPVTSNLPFGRYMQWRATLASNSSFDSPFLHEVTAKYTQTPDVETDDASSITDVSARLNGDLISLYSDLEADVSFEWGTAPGVYDHETTPQQMYGPGPFHADISGLSAHTTYYCRAKVSTVDDGIGFGVEKSFTTSTSLPHVTTNAATAIETSAAFLNGTLTFLGTAATVNVSFQWGTTQGGPYPNATPPQAMTATGAFNYSLSGLSTGTTYYFRAKADGGTHGTGYGAEVSFTTSTAPPWLFTGDATSITSHSATLNGDLASLGTATTVNVSFQYGTTQGGPYPSSTPPQVMMSRGYFTANLTNLTADTTYYFRAKGDGGTQGVGYGNEISFTTSKVPPTMATADATNITITSATLNGALDSMGTATTVNVSFQWGTEPNNLNMETVPQAVTAPLFFHADLSNLSPDTTYYFRPKGDGGQNGTGYGGTMDFTTHKGPPSVTTNDASGITANAATLNGTLHSLGTAGTVNVTFQYGTTSGMYSNETTPQAKTTTGDFQDTLAGLTPDTTYYYRAKANGGIHGIGYGTEHVFTTGKVPPSVTTNNATQLTTNSAALNGTLTALGTATTVNVSFQWGTQQGGPYPNSTSPQAMTGMGAFQAGLTGLSSHTMYYYRAKADGGIHGTNYGDEKSFRTGMFPPYVETDPATGTTDTASTLNGNLQFLGSATTVNVSFEYGTTQGGPYSNSTTPQAKTATGTFQADILSLTPGTTYYYRAKGDGGTYGVSTGAEMSFTTSTLPPIVATQAATDIMSDSATLNGNLDSLGDAATVNVSFQWGTQSGGPYLNSTDEQAMTATGAFQAGLSGLHGDTTYYYRTKADGGIYGAAYGVERSFTTSKVPPSVTTDNATNVAATSATLNGFLDSMGTTDTVNVSFGWGLVSGGPYPNTTPLQTMDSRGYFHADITGLMPLTTYYFKAKADGGAHGSAEGGECSFTTTSTPPSVSTGGVTGVTADAATLNGDLHALGTAATVNVSFQYGTASGVYGDETAPQAMDAPGDFLSNLASLHPDTTYYYRAKADGGAHGTSYGTEHAFTTNALPPSVTTDAVSEKTTDSAALNGNLDDLGSATTVNVSFVYGTTAGGPYPDSTSPQAKTSTGAFQAGLSGLTPFTTYYYKAKADDGVCGTGYGAEMSFTTNHLSPVVGTGSAIDIMTNAAILNGNLYLLGTAPTVNASFEWGTTPGVYSNETTPQAMTEPEAFQAQLTGLTPNTTYYYRAKGDGGVHGIGYGTEHAFTTSAHPPLVATGNATNVGASSATLNGNLDSLGTATTVNVSFEWGTTQGGPYTNSTPLQAITAAGAFQADINDLSLHTVYYFRAKADGGIYGTSYGAEMSFITSPNIPPTVDTGNVGNVTTTAARLNGNLLSFGSSASANVSFQWGTTPGVYTNETTAQTMNATGTFFADLTGLTQNTTYYYRAKAVGDGTGYGTEQSFLTSGTVYEVETATGIGTAYFSSDAGNIQNLVAVAEGTLPTAGKPAGLSFPEGFFSFTVANLVPGSTVTITITLPSVMPVGTQYWKYQNGNWIDCTALLGSNDGDNVITLTITDGGLGDADGLVNGTIVDPGGPGVAVTAWAASAPPARRVSPAQLPPADVRLLNISVSPSQTQAGQPVTVLANVVNNGASSGRYNVALRINGRVEQQRTVEVSPGTAYPVKFTVTRSQPGTYTVNIGDKKGSFVIIGAPSTLSEGTGEIILFGVAIAATGLLSGMLIIIARRRLQGY